MNIQKLFNNRNKNFTRLTEAGDYVGRRLRENLVIYDIDDSQNTVTYITEKNHLISCSYKEIKRKFVLDNFQVENLKSITSDAAIDIKVNESVSSFLGAIKRNRFDSAEDSFHSVMESFSMRAKIEEARKRLQKKMDRFGEMYNITETKAYKKFTESLPMLKKFFEDKKEDLLTNKKLVEGLRLAKTVGETYNLPKLTLENLEGDFIVVPSNSKRTLYEMVCEKELIRKEILEAKESFSRMWASNDTIGTLASHIYSTDGIIKDSLKNAVAEIPYLALTNKVDLTTVLESVFQVTNPGSITQKDIREFVNKIYEFKKPLKNIVVETLNSKYGINVQSLKFVPSFKGLAEIQGELFNIMSEYADEGILSDVLKEFSTAIARKGGVQVLDVANIISSIMDEADFKIIDVNEDFNMKNLAEYLKDNLNDAQYYGDEDELSNDPGMKTVKGKKGKSKKWGGNKGDIKAKDRKKDDDSKLKADEKGDVDDDESDLPNNKLTKKQKKLDKDGDEDIDAKDLKKLRKEALGDEEEIEDEEAEGELKADEEGEADDNEPSEETEADLEAKDKDFRELVGTIESITKDIDLDLEDEEDDDVTPEDAEAPEEGEEAEEEEAGQVTQ